MASGFTRKPILLLCGLNVLTTFTLVPHMIDDYISSFNNNNTDQTGFRIPTPLRELYSTP